MGKLTNIRPLVGVASLNIATVPKKTVAPFYKTREWNELMRRLLSERGGMCAKCGRTNCRIFGDHIVELQDGGDPLDETNVMLLCGSCHTKKTLDARNQRMAQQHRKV